MIEENYIENEALIKNELIRLGFSNAGEMMKAGTVSDSHRHKGKKMIEIDDFDTDKDNIEYMLFLARDKSEGGWHIQTIQAYATMETVRNIEGGYMVVGSSFDIGDGPLPSKDQIRTVIQEKLRNEHEIEGRALAKMNAEFQYNENIHRQLVSLGFTNYKEILPQASFYGDYTILESTEQAHLPSGNDSDSYIFRFKLNLDEKTNQVNLVSIEAALKGLVEINGSVQKMEYIAKFYGSNTNPLQPKKQMINDLLALVDRRITLLEKAKEIVQAATNNASQRNRKILPALTPKRRKK